jgi:hypothetical protein
LSGDHRAEGGEAAEAAYGQAAGVGGGCSGREVGEGQSPWPPRGGNRRLQPHGIGLRRFEVANAAEQIIRTADKNRDDSKTKETLSDRNPTLVA